MDQKQIDVCYGIKDDAKALECLKNIVRADEGKCHPRLVLLTQEDCTPCETEKENHKEALKEGVIQELSIETEEGLAVAIKNEIDYFPALVLLDCDGNVIYPSELPE